MNSALCTQHSTLCTPPAPAAPKVDAPLVWEPKGKRLSGATALVVGIAIGAVLVAVVIGVFFLLRGSGAN